MDMVDGIQMDAGRIMLARITQPACVTTWLILECCWYVGIVFDNPIVGILNLTWIYEQVTLNLLLLANICLI